MTRWQVNNRCIRSFCVRLLSKWYYSTGVDSSIGIVTKLRAGRLRNRASIPGRKKRVLGVTKTRTHFAPGGLSPGLKRQGPTVDHSLLSNAEWVYASNSTMWFYGVHKENFILYVNNVHGIKHVIDPCAIEYFLRNNRFPWKKVELVGWSRGVPTQYQTC